MQPASFEDAIRFHGHACPGLALGFRAATLAMRELGVPRSRDEELVAIVENNSCAVDAIQVVAGCTFGKGNLAFHDYGKQVYTFIKRPAGESIRIAVTWNAPPETDQEKTMWERFSAGERSAEVVRTVRARKAAKVKAVLEADAAELFAVTRAMAAVPGTARIFASVRCVRCHEKVMEPKAVHTRSGPVCLPCSRA